jgi:hypothetical protein
MIDKQLVTREILWAAVDDWTGLWEAVWGIQTMWPDLVGKPAQEMAHSVLTELLARGLVYLCFFDESTSVERRVAGKEASRLLNVAENWQAPSNSDNQLRFAATEAGQQELRSLEASTGAT